MTASQGHAISVCIANYNGEALLPDCIDSVLSQQVDARVEIIVHDDASQDGSLALLASRYPQARVIASTENVGFCIANNRMVDIAGGEYVLLLNNDAALGEGALQALLAEALRIGGDAILTLPQHDWETGALVDRGCLLDPFFNPVPNLDRSRRDVAYVIGACLWITRDFWTELGGLPPWMESLGEDLYICGLARLRGVPVRTLPKSGYYHRQGATFGGNRVNTTGLRTSVKRRRLSERNKTRALFVLTPTLVMWPLLWLHLALLSLESLVLCLLRRDAMLWREIYGPAIATPFREVGTLWVLRRNAQVTRTASLSSWFSAFAWFPRKIALLTRHGVPQIE